VSEKIPCVDCLCIPVCKNRKDDEFDLMIHCLLAFTYVYYCDGKVLPEPSSSRKNLKVLRDYLSNI
jgi:hypothetical protein